MHIALQELIRTYQLDIMYKTNLYVPGKGLPGEVIKHVKPIFESLSHDQLLSKYLHGKTQNQNEVYNAFIWKRIPKDRFVKLKQFELRFVMLQPTLILAI